VSRYSAVLIAAAALSLPMVAVADAPPVEVSARGGLLDVRAEGAYLDDVLERVAAVTGMELDWPRPRPRPRVSATIEGKPAAEAVRVLMEGLRFNYAMRLAPGGGVAMLVVLDAIPGAPEGAHLPPGKQAGTDRPTPPTIVMPPDGDGS
jgi:hypothetical protein